MTVLYKAKVITQDNSLRIRSAPVNGTILGHAPKGSIVSVVEDNNNGWPKIIYNGIIGYSSAEYLKKIEDECNNNNITTLIDANNNKIQLVGKWTIFGVD